MRWMQLELVQCTLLALHYLPRRAHDKVDQHVGFCSRVAIHLAPDAAALLRACERVTDGGAADIRKAARERAERAVKAAHRAWQATTRTEAQAWVEAAE